MWRRRGVGDIPTEFDLYGAQSTYPYWSVAKVLVLSHVRLATSCFADFYSSRGIILIYPFYTMILWVNDPIIILNFQNVEFGRTVFRGRRICCNFFRNNTMWKPVTRIKLQSRNRCSHLGLVSSSRITLKYYARAREKRQNSFSFGKYLRLARAIYSETKIGG